MANRRAVKRVGPVEMDSKCLAHRAKGLVPSAASRHCLVVEDDHTMTGMDKILAFDQSQSLDDLMPRPEANRVRTSGGNGVVTFPGNFGKKA
jgi:hypothetical protein